MVQKQFKILQIVQSNLRTLGFLTSDRKLGPRSVKFIVISMNLLVYIVSSLWFVLYEGETFGARTESFYAICNGMTTFISHLILILQKMDFLQFINDLEQIIQNRETEITISISSF